MIDNSDLPKDWMEYREYQQTLRKESEGFRIMRYWLVYARDMSRAVEDLKKWVKL